MRSPFLASIIFLLVLPIIYGFWKPRIRKSRLAGEDVCSPTTTTSAAGGGTTTTATTTCSATSPSMAANPFHVWDDLQQQVIDTKLARETIRNVKNIIYYKPPVGIVAVLCMVRLIYTGRIFKLFDDDMNYHHRGNNQNNFNSAADAVLRASERQRRRRKVRRQDRAQGLDKYDTAYVTMGGIESVRASLCDAALRQQLTDATADSTNTTTSTTSTTSNAHQQQQEFLQSRLHHALAAIRVTYPSRGTRVNYVRRIVNHLMPLEQSLLPANSKNHFDAPNTAAVDGTSMVEMAQLVAEIRIMDALLRVSRDRLLTTCSRLKRLVTHWKGRVYLSTAMGHLFADNRFFSAFSFVFSSRTEKESRQVRANRERLALAQGAYQAEMKRLGKTVRALNRRPTEMAESQLIEALAMSTAAAATAAAAAAAASHNNNDMSDTSSTIPSSNDTPWSVSWFNKIAIRWNADGMGRLTIRWLEQDTSISGEAARSVLQNQADASTWVQESQAWIDTARHDLCDVLRESAQKDFGDDAAVKAHVTSLVEWCARDRSRSREQWESVLELVEHIDERQRIGEGTAMSLADSKFTRWLRRLDLFGIPSSLLVVGSSHVLHRVLEPKWPVIRTSILQSYSIVFTIFKKRVWTPLLDILVNLISRKNPSLLEFFDVTNEVASLDNMLRDLGFGDGTEATRQEALILASRRYEMDLQGGSMLLRSAALGRLPRLLLVQVQQLKAGLLHALDGIDALVAANRLNVQLLAGIPAVLIITLGIRFILRSIYTFRLKAIRSVRDVHSEMSDYLDEMEKCILVGDAAGSDVALGAFVLDMHSYLVLLDYSSPLVPARLLDGIHKSMQDLLLSDGLQNDLASSSSGASPIGNGRSMDRQIQIVRLLKEKHRGLLAHL
ncbi:ATP synthase regulation protein NCA2 [Fragilaria crotonensis]|nr:ATP synthase regulation protein NCA2 [Fragilaria crotonensis]